MVLDVLAVVRDVGTMDYELIQHIFPLPLMVCAFLTGLPAIVVPCGTSTSKDFKDLPIGIQLVGGSFKEMQLLQLAHVFEVTSKVVGAVPA